MPWFNLDRLPKSKVCDFQIANQALDQNLHLALEPKVLKLEGSALILCLREAFKLNHRLLEPEPFEKFLVGVGCGGGACLDLVFGLGPSNFFII